MKEYDCPADGCDYSGHREKVLGHYSGKQDEAHSGGYHDAKQMLSDSADGGIDNTPDDSPAEGSQNPIVDGGQPSSPEPSSEDEVELPCGHESFSEEDAPEPPFEATCETCDEDFGVSEL